MGVLRLWVKSPFWNHWGVVVAGCILAGVLGLLALGLVLMDFDLESGPWWQVVVYWALLLGIGYMPVLFGFQRVLGWGRWLRRVTLPLAVAWPVGAGMVAWVVLGGFEGWRDPAFLPVMAWSLMTFVTFVMLPVVGWSMVSVVWFLMRAWREGPGVLEAEAGPGCGP